jgi:cell wall-associated NlpC family hydrolase
MAVMEGEMPGDDSCDRLGAPPDRRRLRGFNRLGAGWVTVWVLLAPAAVASDLEARLDRSIQKKLGRPYVWGAEGLKSYDCSGFVWRAYRDAGIRFKRTTARKMYYALPEAGPEDLGRLGTLVFFNRVDHVGIVRNGQEFYHAASTRGTTLAPFNSYWLKRACGYRIVKTREPK